MLRDAARAAEKQLNVMPFQAPLVAARGARERLWLDLKQTATERALTRSWLATNLSPRALISFANIYGFTDLRIDIVNQTKSKNICVVHGSARGTTQNLNGWIAFCRLTTYNLVKPA